MATASLTNLLRHRVRAGFELPEDILREIPQIAGHDADLVADLEAIVHQEREQLALEQKTWPRVTTNDRIMIAFIALTRARIVALEDVGVSVADGWSVVAEAKAAVPRARGAVFYHAQDLERGVRGEGLHLAFGSFPREHPDEHARSLVIGHEVVAVLTKSKVATEWDGSLETRIRIPPFVWQRRLLPNGSL